MPQQRRNSRCGRNCRRQQNRSFPRLCGGRRRRGRESCVCLSAKGAKTQAQPLNKQPPLAARRHSESHQIECSTDAEDRGHGAGSNDDPATDRTPVLERRNPHEEPPMAAQPSPAARKSTAPKHLAGDRPARTHGRRSSRSQDSSLDSWRRSSSRKDDSAPARPPDAPRVHLCPSHRKGVCENSVSTQKGRARNAQRARQARVQRPLVFPSVRFNTHRRLTSVPLATKNQPPSAPSSTPCASFDSSRGRCSAARRAA